MATCNQCNEKLYVMFRGRQVGLYHWTIEDGIKCGETIEVVDDEEIAQLQARYAKRLACWEAVKAALRNATSGERAKGKGCRNRKWFINYLRGLCRVFTTVEEESFQIGMFGQGAWAKKVIKCFNAEEQDLIRRTIAREMGAYVH
jgi:hypothetical protein